MKAGFVLALMWAFTLGSVLTFAFVSGVEGRLFGVVVNLVLGVWSATLMTHNARRAWHALKKEEF